MSQTQHHRPSLAPLEVGPGSRKRIPCHDLQLKTGVSIPSVCLSATSLHAVGTSPQALGGKLFPRAQGHPQVRRLFGMRATNVIFPPQIWQEPEKGVTDERTGLSWVTSRGPRGGPGQEGGRCEDEDRG